MHNLRARKKRRKTVDVLNHTLLSHVRRLSTLHYKLNFLCESSDDFLFLEAKWRLIHA